MQQLPLPLNQPLTPEEAAYLEAQRQAAIAYFCDVRRG